MYYNLLLNKCDFVDLSNIFEKVSMQEYLLKAKRLSDSLASAGVLVSESDLQQNILTMINHVKYIGIVIMLLNCFNHFEQSFNPSTVQPQASQSSAHAYIAQQAPHHHDVNWYMNNDATNYITNELSTLRRPTEYEGRH